MTSKIKALVLAFVAITAMTAVAASGAQAGKLDVGVAPAVLTAGSDAGQETVLSVQNTAKTTTLNAKCTTASLEGTVEVKTVEEATLTATYGTGKGVFSEAQGCTVGGIKSQVLMNGCKYTVTGVEQAANTYVIDITGCTSGKQIEVNVAAGGCALKIPEQTGLKHVIGKQLNAQEVTLEGTAAEIKVQQSGGASCPDGATAHTGTSGAFTSNTILKAFQDSGTKQVTKHGHQYTEHLCGTQVQIQST